MMMRMSLVLLFCMYFLFNCSKSVKIFLHKDVHQFLCLFFSLRPSDSDSRSDIIFDNGDESVDEMSQVCLFEFTFHFITKIYHNM